MKDRKEVKQLAKLIIKELAQAQNLTQHALAEKSGVTPQLISSYWNNYVQRVSLEHLEMIANALGKEPGELIISNTKAMGKGMKYVHELGSPAGREDPAA